ncbi:MAG: hypothetical protein ACOCRK_11370, partial [bacterium]
MHKDSEDTSFFSKIDKGYNDFKIKTIHRLADINADSFLQESPYLDSGYIKTKIKNLKKEISSVISEINSLSNSFSKEELENTNIDELLARKNELIYGLVFLSSNSFKNLDKCLYLLQDLDTDFKKCIYGL